MLWQSSESGFPCSERRSSTYGKPNARSWAYANQPTYDGPGSSGYPSYDDRRGGGRSVRGRGRGGSWNYNAGGSRDMDRNGGGRDGDHYDNRRAEGSGSWRRDDRRDDRNPDTNGPKKKKKKHI